MAETDTPFDASSSKLCSVWKSGYLQNHPLSAFENRIWLKARVDLGGQTAQFNIFKVISTTILKYFDVV